MGRNTVKTADTVPAALFISFAFSIAGWALLELWLLQIGAGLRAHGMAALFGLWLGFLSIRRPRIGRAGLSSASITATSGHRKFGRADAGWVLVFLMAGGILGSLVLRGQTIVLVVAAIGLALVPWSRVRFCCRHLLTACTAIWTGMVSIIALGHGSIDPVFLPIACWVLWASSMVSLVLRIEQLSRAERISKAQPEVLHPTPSAHIST
jgi:hypothetical protein